MKVPKVSVVIITYNESAHIKECLESVLGQRYGDMEVIVVDSYSSDGTTEIIKSFRDDRLELVLTKTHCRAVARNKGLNRSKGEFVFFIDGDCVASKNWIKAGIAAFKSGIVGVEGRTYYVSKDFKPTMRDKVHYNITGGIYPTSNIAYRRKTLENLNGFDERLHYAEDVDLAIRAKKIGSIVFNSKMLVTHQREFHPIKGFFYKEERLRCGILLIKKHYESKIYRIWRIAYPISALMLNPFFVLVYFVLSRRRIENITDLAFIPLYFIRPYITRAAVWKAARQEGIFLI